MMPFGAIAAISLAGVLKGTIVEYTLHSRMRRAMTCVYCDPKSRMTICSFIEGQKFVRDDGYGEEKLGGRTGFWRRNSAGSFHQQRAGRLGLGGQALAQEADDLFFQILAARRPAPGAREPQ